MISINRQTPLDVNYVEELVICLFVVTDEKNLHCGALRSKLSLVEPQRVIETDQFQCVHETLCDAPRNTCRHQIGRASCRERV